MESLSSDVAVQHADYSRRSVLPTRALPRTSLRTAEQQLDTFDALQQALLDDEVHVGTAREGTQVTNDCESDGNRQAGPTSELDDAIEDVVGVMDDVLQPDVHFEGKLLSSFETHDSSSPDTSLHSRVAKESQDLLQSREAEEETECLLCGEIGHGAPPLHILDTCAWSIANTEIMYLMQV